MRRAYLGFSVAATILVPVAVVVTYVVAETQYIKDVAEILGNAGTALALFWIIVGYAQQSKQLNLQRDELGLQRQELGLQRQALQQQVDELKKAHKLSLDQEIARMLSDAHNSLMSAGGGLEDLSQIFTAVIPKAEHRIAFESIDANQVMQAVKKYFDTAGKVMIFLGVLAEAAKMYFNARCIRYTDDSYDAEFIDVHYPLLRDVFLFRRYIALASVASKTLVSIEPGIRALEFARLAAFLDLYPQYVRIGTVIPEYLYFKEHSTMPAIGEKVAHVFEDFIKRQACSAAA